jgi:hypothetical protein
MLKSSLCISTLEWICEGINGHINVLIMKNCRRRNTLWHLSSHTWVNDFAISSYCPLAKKASELRLDRWPLPDWLTPRLSKDANVFKSNFVRVWMVGGGKCVVSGALSSEEAEEACFVLPITAGGVCSFCSSEYEIQLYSMELSSIYPQSP